MRLLRLLFLRRRGWRNFFTAACVHIRYELTFGDVTVQGTSDRGGYIDHRVRGHGVEPGWRQAQISVEEIFRHLAAATAQVPAIIAALLAA